MLRLIIGLILLNVGQLCYSQANEMGNVQVMNFDQLEPILHKKNDTLYLVNFWATWCAPCKKELPDILKIGEKYSGKKFKIILVSLDIPSQLQARLLPFILANNIKDEVILLDDPNQNRWIDKVDTTWSGEIPFTVLYRKEFKKTYNTMLSFETLDTIINQKINTP